MATKPAIPNILGYTYQGVNALDIIPTPPRPDPDNDEEVRIFERSSCDTEGASPPTPARLTPDVETFRDFADITQTVPDGRQFRFWILADTTDPVNGFTFPSPLMRFREGQVVHSVFQSHHGLHTIHHHGIEPEPMNDGVGHTSFEANHYTYQFVLREGSAGTYFYHCHRNTTLHFEMGMFGFLIVDPPEGPGRLYAGGPRYDKEFLWVADDVDDDYRIDSGGDTAGQPENKFGLDCNNPNDPYWGLIPPNRTDFFPFNPGLSKFVPNVFHLSGVFAPAPPTPPLVVDPRISPVAAGGERVLIRLLNAAYNLIRCTFGLPATVEAIDARPLGGGNVNPDLPHTRYSRPFVIPAGTPFILSTARRFDLLFHPTLKGTYPMKIEFLDWITRQPNGSIETTFTVTKSKPFIAPINQLLLG